MAPERVDRPLRMLKLVPSPYEKTDDFSFSGPQRTPPPLPPHPPELLPKNREPPVMTNHPYITYRCMWLVITPASHKRISQKKQSTDRCVGFFSPARPLSKLPSFDPLGGHHGPRGRAPAPSRRRHAHDGAAHPVEGPGLPGGGWRQGVGQEGPRGVGGVQLQVLVELVLAHEGLAADVAGVGPLPGVDGLHVPLEVVAAAEVLLAQPALVRLDAGVGGDVALEVDVLGEVLAALGAGEGARALVAPRVHLEGAVAGEGVAAVVAGERGLRARVEPHVTQQVGARAVALVARAAREPRLRVSPHVLPQALAVGEHLVAQLTHVPPPSPTLVVAAVGGRGPGRGAREPVLQHLPALLEEHVGAVGLVLAEVRLRVEDLAADQAQRGRGGAVQAVRRDGVRAVVPRAADRQVKAVHVRI